MNPQTRFSERAQAYAQNRPGYAPAVIDALLEGLPQQGLSAADIGAGTGLSSAALAQRVERVIAVEPNENMRRAAQTPAAVQWREGTAEQTGLADRSVDLAATFQAFHWFDAPAAFAEFKRIARLRIGMVQYERDESQPLAAADAALIRPYMIDDTETRRMHALDDFARLAGPELHRARIPDSQIMSASVMLGRLDSSSYLPREGAAAQALRAEALRLFENHEREGRVELAMTMHVLYVNIA